MASTAAGAAHGTGLSPVVVEDLIQGMNEWRNIQDIVRITFKAFHDVLRSQGEAIKSLERAMEGKAGRTELAAALQQKLSVAEAHGKFAELSAVLGSKSDAGEMAMELDRRPTRTEMQGALAGKATAADLRMALESKPSSDDLSAIKTACDRAVDAVAADVARHEDRMEEILARISCKMSRSEVDAALGDKADMKEVEERLRANSKAGRQALQKAMDEQQHCFEAMISSAKEEVTERQSREFMRRAEVEELRGVVAREVVAVRDEVKGLSSRLQSEGEVTAKALRGLSTGFDEAIQGMRTALESSATQAQLQESMGRMRAELHVLRGDVKSGEVAGAMEGHETLASLRRAVDQKADIAQVAELISQKASVMVLANRVERMEASCVGREEMEMMMEKGREETDARIRLAADAKAGVVEVNRALMEVNQELDSRVTLAEFQRIVRSQANVNAAMATESCVGRWMWKSGKTRVGHAVPWNLQALNSDTENLIWEKDKGSIMCIAAGLYEISFGFFTRKKPQVQLLINGEPVLAAVNSASYVVHHSSGRLTSVGRHSAGNVTGLTLVDFLALPFRARVSITFLAGNGDICDDATGFLSLKKL